MSARVEMGMPENEVDGTAWLVCALCAAAQPLGAAFWGCTACAAEGRWGTLEVAYAPALAQRAWVGWPAQGRRAAGASLWDRPGLLPPVAAARRLSLGEGGTALPRLEPICQAAGIAELYLKNEGGNPTWAHKDRFHAVAVAMAAELGYAKVVSASTGNHGASMAAYAALHGLRALVLCHEETPPLLTDLMRAFGATVVQTDQAAREELLCALVAQHGWYPATSPALPPVGNPYGAEGYKTLAYEIVEGLGGQAPAHVLTPTAAGDGLRGMWRGFCELRDAGLIERLPRLHSCQPSDVAPLVRAWEGGQPEVVELASGRSRALSIGDRISGSHALAAVRASGGSGIAVGEEEIEQAQRLLARCGLAVESASAAPVAGALRLRSILHGEVEGPVVCVLTSAAIKWPAEMGGLARGALLRDAHSVAELEVHGVL